MKATHLLIVALAIFSFCVAVQAESIQLKSGDRIEGVVVKTVGTDITVRTKNGISHYDVSELDQIWVDQHYEKLYTRVRRQKTDATTGFFNLLAGLVEEKSLAGSSQFLKDHADRVVPVSGALLALGLAQCFFGWKLFKLRTLVLAVLAGVILGLFMAGLFAGIAGAFLPVHAQPWGKIGLFLLAVIPSVLLSVRFSRRFAMFGERTNALRGVGGGLVGSLFALSRYAFFDLGIVWGNGILGALLIAAGAYCAAVPILLVPDDLLQWTLILSAGAAMLLCIVGALHQIHALRSAPASGYRGEY